MPECGRSLRRQGRGGSLQSERGVSHKGRLQGEGKWPRRPRTRGEGQSAAGRQLAGERRDIWRASRQGAEQAGCHVEWALREPRGLRADRGGSFPPPERLRYSQESRTLLALSWRRGLRGLGLLPWGVGRPGAGAAPPPAGILGLPPARHSGGGGGGGRSGPAPVSTSPQHAAASGPRRRRHRRRRRRVMLLGLLWSRLGRRRLSPFLVLLLRGSRLFRLPRHRGSSVPHPLVPGGGGGGGGSRGAAPPAPFASRSVRLNLTLRSSFPPSPPPGSEGAPPRPLPLKARYRWRRARARHRRSADQSERRDGFLALPLVVSHAATSPVPSPTPSVNQSGNGSKGAREVSFPAHPFSPLNGCVSRQS